MDDLAELSSTPGGGGDRPRRLPPGVIALGGLMALTAGLCLVALWRGWISPAAVQSVVARSGRLGMAIYVGAVVVMELLWMPRMWGLLAGGLLFGPIWGGALSVIGDLAGGLTCYVLARSAGREWAAGLLARRPRASAVIDLLARRRGAAIIAVLRVCPVAHYTVVSYAAGLVGVSPSSFLLGTGLGIIPGAVIYPIAGDAALRPGSPAFLLSLGVVLIALILSLIAARRVLRT